MFIILDEKFSNFTFQKYTYHKWSINMCIVFAIFVEERLIKHFNIYREIFRFNNIEKE